MNPDAPARPTGPLPDPAHSIVPDEAALRGAFDRHADEAARHAARELGEAANLAPKVVEHVFLNVWRSRGTLQSEEALVRFLDEEVRHDSARVLSRRLAAQRLGGGVHEKGRSTPTHAEAHEPWDRETSWTRLLQEVHGRDRDEAHAEAAKIGHHEAAHHIADVSRGHGWLRPALTAAGVLICAVGAIWVLDQASRGAKLDAAVASSTARSIEANAGQIGSVTLDDGSSVQIAPDSRLVIPEHFGAELRGLRVEGAARIRVAEGVGETFTVKARKANLEASGTAFVVRAYEGDSVAVVVLEEGALTIRRGDEERTLAPGEAVAIPDSSAIRNASPGETAEATSWTRNRLTVHDRRLGDVLPEFRRWYNTQIFAPETKILDRRVTLDASLDSVRQAIGQVERGANVRFTYLQDKMVFVDATDGAKPSRK